MTSTDQDILRRIEALIAEEHHLYHQMEMTIGERDRLGQLTAELDRLWDELRRARARRRVGLDDEPQSSKRRKRK